MTNKKSIRSESSRSAVLEPDSITGSAIAEDLPRPPAEDTIGRETEPPRGPLPPGAIKEDYVGGRPERGNGPRGRRSGRKNRLV